MGFFVILLCIVVGLVSADQESKSIGTASKSNEDLAINSLHHVAFFDSEARSSNPDQNLPDQNLPDQNFLDQILPDQNLLDQTLSLRELPDQNILGQNLPAPQNPPYQNIPLQRVPVQNPPDQNLPAPQNLSDHKNLPHHNPPHHSLPDEQAPEDATPVSELALSNDVESQETGNGLGRFSPVSNSVWNATSDCSTAPSHRTTFRTFRKHFQMLRKHRNTDATSINVAPSAAKKTRTRLQGKLKISTNTNNNNDMWTELYKRLPHKLRLAIAKTNRHEHRFLEEAAHSRDRVALKRIWELCIEKRLDERVVLRALVDEAGSNGGGALVVGYKALRNGESWEKGNPRFVNFFRTDSPLLSEYETWKKGELEIDLNETEVENQPPGSAWKTRHGSDTNAKETEANGNQEAQTPGVEEARRVVLRRKIRGADDSVAMTESHSVLQSLFNRLPDVLKDKMTVTDNFEIQILDLCASEKNVTHKEIGVYKSAKKVERELLKRVLKEAETYGPKILQIYKLIRKGDAWDFVKLNNTYEPFFENPSPELNVYEEVKKDELSSLDAFLQDDKQPATQNDDESDAETGVDAMHRIVRAEEDDDGKSDRSENREQKMDEKLKKAEGTITEGKVSVEASVDVNETTTQEVNGTEDILTSRDHVTSAGAAAGTKKTEADTLASDRRSVVGLAIILSVFINAILAIVIVALYKKEILIWYRRRQLEKGILPKGETEPLNHVNKLLRTSNTFM